MEVILASASPRRLSLLEQIGIKAQVFPSEFNEICGTAKDAQDIVLANALGKGADIVQIKGDKLPVIAADTLVVIDNIVLGKPHNQSDAQVMLKRLSGRSHQVMTGVAVYYQGKKLGKVCVTDVVFRQLSEQEISSYVSTGEPLDKAGAYGIQGRGALLVEKIDGCYNNVVGLPLSMLYLMLKEIGADII